MVLECEEEKTPSLEFDSSPCDTSGVDSNATLVTDGSVSVVPSSDQDSNHGSASIEPSLDKDSTSSSNVREVTFNGVSNALSIIIPALINKCPSDIVVDSAAQVTVLSEQFVKRMQHPPITHEDVKLKGAGNNHFMSARYAKGVSIKIGTATYLWNVYIAPISDNVILGLDFMLHHKVKLDLEFNTVSIGSQVIPATLKRNVNGDTYQVSRVLLGRNTVVPPNSVVQVTGNLEHPMDGNYMVQPKEKQLLLMPSRKTLELL